MLLYRLKIPGSDVRRVEPRTSPPKTGSKLVERTCCVLCSRRCTLFTPCVDSLRTIKIMGFRIKQQWINKQWNSIVKPENFHAKNDFLAFRTVASSFIAADQGIHTNLFNGNLVNNFLFTIPDACIDALEPIFGKRHRWELISTACKSTGVIKILNQPLCMFITPLRWLCFNKVGVHYWFRHIRKLNIFYLSFFSWNQSQNGKITQFLWQNQRPPPSHKK